MILKNNTYEHYISNWQPDTIGVYRAFQNQLHLKGV